MIAVHLGLLLLGDLATHLVATLCLLALGFGGLCVAGVWLGSASKPVLVLAVAALLRVLLLPVAPTLSNDVLRYLWDGRVVVHGENPYRLAPDAPRLEALRDGLWHELHHRDVPTVYPPLAMLTFVAAAALPASVDGRILFLKALLTLADLVTCALVVYLARRLGLPSSRTIWYAWNPMVVLEVAGMGHVDALGVAAVLAGVCLLERRAPLAPRRVLALASVAAAGVLAKVGPLVCLPLWARLSGRPWRFLGFSSALLVVGVLPVLVACGGLPPGLVRYGVSWEFNGPLFEPLWRLLAWLEVPAGIEGLLDRLKAATNHHPFWNRLYPYNYPQLLAKMVLGAGMVAVIFASVAFAAGRQRRAIEGTGWLFGALLLLSATVYPWYLLWILPFAALAGQRAWLALSALMPLTYLPLLGLSFLPWVFLAIWLPFAILLVRCPRWSTG